MKVIVFNERIEQFSGLQSIIITLYDTLILNITLIVDCQLCSFLYNCLLGENILYCNDFIQQLFYNQHITKWLFPFVFYWEECGYFLFSSNTYLRRSYT